MSDAMNVYFEGGEWWCDYTDEDGKQHHYLGSFCIGLFASWLQEKDAEIERLTSEAKRLQDWINDCVFGAADQLDPTIWEIANLRLDNSRMKETLERLTRENAELTARVAWLEKPTYQSVPGKRMEGDHSGGVTDMIEPTRCPECGYTEADARQMMDHRYCSNYGKAPWSAAAGERIAEPEEREGEG